MTIRIITCALAFCFTAFSAPRYTYYFDYVKQYRHQPEEKSVVTAIQLNPELFTASSHAEAVVPIVTQPPTTERVAPTMVVDGAKSGHTKEARKN